MLGPAWWKVRSFSPFAKHRANYCRLMGFAHRAYDKFDPRVKIIRGMCHKVLAGLVALTIRCSS